MKKLICTSIMLLSTNSLANTNYEPFELFRNNLLPSFKSYFLKSSNNNILGQTYSTNNIYLDYDENELSANKKYKEKNLRIKGKLDRITEDAFGNVFLIEGLSASPLGSSHFKVDKSNQRLLELKKGQSFDLVCLLDSFSLESLIFKNCYFTDEYLDKILLSIKKDFSTILSNEYKPSSKIEAIFSYSFISNKENILSVCSQEHKSCNENSLSKSKFYLKYKENTTPADSYFDSLFGSGWFKSLPKLPHIE